MDALEALGAGWDGMGELDYVDWDNEVDPFPMLPQIWEPASKEDKRLVDELLSQPSSNGTGSPTATPQSGDTQWESGAHEVEGAAQLAFGLEASEAEDSTTKPRGAGRRAGSAARAKQAPAAAEAEKHETAEERKARMAAACRRFRAKRKEEITSLKRKNEVLEQEREMYRTRIAELQTEAQTLRDHGTVDVGKENDLLRAEIRKHKRFISLIVSAARSAPLVTDEEKFRLLSTGVASAVGQVTGLCYTSASDPNWRYGKRVDIAGQSAHIKYQYLPLGSEPVDSKRFNIRMDFTRLPDAADKMLTRLWAMWTDEKTLKDVFFRHFQEEMELQELMDFTIAEVFPDLNCDATVDWKKENIKVFRYEESYTTDHSNVDLVAATAVKEVTIFPSAFPSMPEVDGTDSKAPFQEGPMDAFVLISSSSTSIGSSSEHFAPAKEGVLRIKHPVLEGYVVVPLPGGGCHVTFVGSFPVGKRSFIGLTPRDMPAVDERGELSGYLFKMLEALLYFVQAEPPEVDPPHMTTEIIETVNGMALGKQQFDEASKPRSPSTAGSLHGDAMGPPPPPAPH